MQRITIAWLTLVLLFQSIVSTTLWILKWLLKLKIHTYARSNAIYKNSKQRDKWNEKKSLRKMYRKTRRRKRNTNIIYHYLKKKHRSQEIDTTLERHDALGVDMLHDAHVSLSAIHLWTTEEELWYYPIWLEHSIPTVNPEIQEDEENHQGAIIIPFRRPDDNKHESWNINIESKKLVAPAE